MVVDTVKPVSTVSLASVTADQALHWLQAMVEYAREGRTVRLVPTCLYFALEVATAAQLA